MATSNAVLVTGCSSGIGRATALALVRAGLPTWASARRVETLTELEASGCRVVELDVTREESRVRAVETVMARDGAVGALINNAGYTEVGPLEETSLPRLQRLFETNVFGLLRMCQLVLPAMRAQSHGTIVNVGSVAGLLTPPGGGAYSMSKYAIEALSDALRYEVRSFGVRVVLLQPSGVRTELMTTGMATMPEGGGDSTYATFKENFTRMVARAHREGAPEILAPEDVARVVVKAVTSRRPKARYRIGLAAHVAPFIRRAAGDRVWDAMMTTQAAVQ